MSVLDYSKKAQAYFEEITKIPHGSYHEKGLCDYVENFAKEHHLDYYRDDMDNIVVYKDASEGYEDHAPVMLQGHMDMVCEKIRESDHDFTKDPLDLYIDEKGWLHARGTTLGADDGVAVAYMLAVLSETNCPHPPLDCLFTVQEEVGLCGAMHIKKENIRARRMISMDGGGEVVTAVSASGGTRCMVYKKLTWENNDKATYHMTLSGLLGGHSGGCIHLERGNAIKLAFRILHDLLIRDVDLRLISLEGGAKENAIAREAEIVFASDTNENQMKKLIKESLEKIQVELAFSDPDLKVTCAKTDTVTKAMSKELSREIIRLIYLLPNGFKARSMKIEGLTTVSLNLGIMNMDDSQLALTYAIRSPMPGAIEQLLNEIQELGEIFHAEVKTGNAYPGWNYEPDSPLREIMRKLVKDCFGKDLIEHAGHGGLETGVLKGEIPDLDIVTFGPISSGAHTPDECLDLKSFDRCYDVLKEFLKRL